MIVHTAFTCPRMVCVSAGAEQHTGKHKEREARDERQRIQRFKDDVGWLRFLVDEIGDVIEVEEAAFEPPPDTMPGFLRELVTGVFKLEDHLLLVLDSAAAAELESRRAVELGA